MKKLILIGNVACGKTTLCQKLNGLEQVYKKTQAVEVIARTIDTPGEYLEHRSFLQGLIAMSVEVDQAFFVQDATQERFMYSPGQAFAFPVPVAGVISKVDVASEKEIAQARELLELTGANPIFEVSAKDGTGIEELLVFLQEETGEKTANNH